MLTTKVNIYHPDDSPQFFCAIIHSWGIQLSICFPSNHHLFPLTASKAIFKLEKGKGGNQ